ncbi:ribonuclease J [bacterium]|nr:ribonuclease J [bacterium]
MLKIGFLGGQEEVGRNMIFFEDWSQKKPGDILIVDCGLRFPEEDMPGVDYIIPNVDYLVKNKDRIKGMVITHGHYDHIGAIPYLLDRLGNPTIYTAPLTAGIIKKRQQEFPDAPKPNIEIFYKNYRGKKVKIGVFEVFPFHVNHNIPDSVGLAIKTPVGLIFHSGDFKFDFHPVGERRSDPALITRLASKKALLLLADSTGAEKPGFSISEKVIYQNLEQIFEKAKGRIIAATFASLISRIQQLIWLGEKFGRYIVIDGLSMRTNVEVCRQLGYLKIKKGILISPKESLRLPPEKVLIICTGSQAEDQAVLQRIANKEHKYFQIEPGDTVIFSSSVIPGNERAVQNLKDSLARQGAKIYHYQMMDIHASGHACQEDLKLLISLIQPKFFIPIHGQYSMLQANADLAKELGIPEENIVIPINGDIVELTPDSIKISKEKVEASYVMVDGLGVGDVGEVVLRDREMLAKDGIFVIIAVIDSRIGKVRGSPDIISRGFVYLRESKELLAEVRKLTKEIVAKTASRERTKNWAYVKANLRDKIGEFLYQKTKRRPMVLPVVIEV